MDELTTKPKLKLDGKNPLPVIEDELVTGGGDGEGVDGSGSEIGESKNSTANGNPGTEAHHRENSINTVVPDKEFKTNDYGTETTSKSETEQKNNTAIYVIVGIVVVSILIIICCCCGMTIWTLSNPIVDDPGTTVSPGGSGGDDGGGEFY